MCRLIPWWGKYGLVSNLEEFSVWKYDCFVCLHKSTPSAECNKVKGHFIRITMLVNNMFFRHPVRQHIFPFFLFTNIGGYFYKAIFLLLNNQGRRGKNKISQVQNLSQKQNTKEEYRILLCNFCSCYAADSRVAGSNPGRVNQANCVSSSVVFAG